MLSYKQNLIHSSEIGDYTVQRYKFKSMTKDTVTESPKIVDVADGAVSGSDIQVVPQAVSSLEKDLIDRLLRKSDELSSSLAKLEIQFEKTQSSMQESIERTSEESYKRGLEEGKNQARAELEIQMNTERERIVQSLVALESALKDTKSHLDSVEKELSEIAVDMAKEVILKEVEENSQKVALELAKSLVSSLMDSARITIKVNPHDYSYIKDNTDPTDKITVESDPAISKGGVVISSSTGNVDGSIMSRYRMLKQSVLDGLQ